MNLPNFFSLIRLPLALAFVLVDAPLTRGILIVSAGLTDFIDGWLARHFGQRSRTGELLDPVTDKLFTLVVLVTLLVERELAWWQLLLLLLRDFVITVFYMLARLKRLPLRFVARISGKIVTVCQIATVFAVLLIPALTPIMLGITTIASLYSIYDYATYARAGLREIRRAS